MEMEKMVDIDQTTDKYDMMAINLLGQDLVFNGAELTFGTEGGDPKYAANSNDPYRRSRRMNSYEGSITDVAMEFFPIIREAKRKRTNFDADFFNFGNEGDYEHMVTLLNCEITNISLSHGDDGKTFDFDFNSLTESD